MPLLPFDIDALPPFDLMPFAKLNVNIQDIPVPGLITDVDDMDRYSALAFELDGTPMMLHEYERASQAGPILEMPRGIGARNARRLLNDLLVELGISDDHVLWITPAFGER